MRLAERFVAAVGTIWLAASLVFFALRLLPGDAIQAQLMHSGASPAVAAERRAQLGLDAPILTQYAQFLLGVVQGDMGYSLLDGQPVTDMILQRLAPTVALAFSAILVSASAGITLGAISAFDGALPWTARALVSLTLSTPIYWSGTLAIYVFAVLLGLLPSAGGDSFSQLLLPALVLGLHTAGGIARLVEASVREAKSADFVRTARAKGLPERLILRRHVLRVGLLPVVTIIALQTGFLLGGTVITESLFVRPGIGRLLLDSTLQQDYPVVQGITVLLAAVYAIANALADMLYTLLDPRVAKPA